MSTLNVFQVHFSVCNTYHDYADGDIGAIYVKDQIPDTEEGNIKSLNNSTKIAGMFNAVGVISLLICAVLPLHVNSDSTETKTYSTDLSELQWWRFVQI